MSVQLTLRDGSEESVFTILPTEDGKAQRVTVQTIPWEPGDVTIPFRVALHPWIEGLGPSRISPNVTMGGDLRNRPAMVYAKANGDASYDTFFTFPPKITFLNQPVTVAPGYSGSISNLPYDTGAYGTTPYMGAGVVVGDIAVAVRNYEGNAYLAGGQFLFRLDSSLALTLVKDFGAGTIISDLEVFNEKLYVALGDTDEIWEMNSGEVFTHSANVFAICFGRNEDKMWRVENPNLVSNCIDEPLLLTSWVPESPEQYTAGDTTWIANDLTEYSGSIAAVKPDGAYFPNQRTQFFNQTPQLAVYPDIDNGKGYFSAFGFLYVPSIAGLLEVSVGISPAVGPELAGRPDFRTRVRAGVEWNRDIYAGTADEARIEETFICKMDRQFSSPFAYHEWARMGTVSPIRVMIVYTGSENPTLVSGIGQQVALITLGRGSGRDIDDSNYEYGEHAVLEPGLFLAGQDLGIAFDWHGVKVVGKQVPNGTLSCFYDLDMTGSWAPMKSTFEGAGKISIEDTGWFSTVRFLPPNSTGHAPQFRLEGTMPPGQRGKDRTEVYEVWAFGNLRPENTDIITVDIYAAKQSRVRGLFQGRKKSSTYSHLRDIYRDGRIVELKLPGYSEHSTVHVKLVEIKQANMSTTAEGTNEIPANSLRLTFRRVDFSGDFNVVT